MKDNQAKYPQLRFNGFTNPWEKRTLGQTTTKAKSYSLSRDVERDHETGYRYIHYGDIHTGVADIVTEHTKLPNIEPANYDELRVNDLVVADASEDYQGIAEPAAVVGLPTHLVAGLHTITLRPSSASSLYLYYLLHTDSFKHFGYQMGTGLKVFGISWSNLSKFTFMIPSRPEQEMIVKLIESVDNLIAVNQRKLAKLKELKQGYLQKMFPQNGSKFPQLRFAGFADDWEQVRFGDLYDKINEKNDLSFGSDQIISVANMYYKESSNVNSSDDYMKTYNIFRKGDIAFEGHKSKHYSYGRFVENDIGDGIVSHVFDVFRPKTDYDLYFWKYLINNENVMGHVLRRVTTKATMMNNLVAKDFLKASIHVPTTEEQTKIGNFLATLDSQITIHQRKLDLLKEQKKGFLQKMFI